MVYVLLDPLKRTLIEVFDETLVLGQEFTNLKIRVISCSNTQYYDLD